MFIQYIKDDELTMNDLDRSNIVIYTYGEDENMTSLTFNLNEVTTAEQGRVRLSNEWNKNGSNQIAVMYQPLANTYYLAHSDGENSEFLCNLPRCLTPLINEGNCMEIYNSSVTNIVIHGSLFVELLITMEFV